MSIPSPCINVCHMNQASGYCEGCYRSIPEITEWSRASDARKQAILGEVAARRAAADLVEPDLRGECVRD
ncbi:MAG: DUF1289 domain-containing protein [Zoogloea sp.]|nr:DUF1289 domain-containing protein [Zoogloea sp.]